MTAEETLDLILNHACPTIELEDGYKRYELNLHCNQIVIFAKPLADGKWAISFCIVDD